MATKTKKEEGFALPFSISRGEVAKKSELLNKSYLKKVYMERVSGLDDGVEIDELEDFVIEEQRIALYLNGEKILTTMSLPDDQDAHAVGFLMSEGVIEDMRDIQNISIKDEGLSVHVDAKINPKHLKNLYKEKTLTSGCCVGVTGNVENLIVREFLDSDISIETNKIWEITRRFYKESVLFELTGCVHKAMLVLKNGVELSAEDIGRHNAIDKVVGKAKLSGLDTKDAIMVVSGRLSLEMMIKAIMHKIPIVISKAAPTMLGIKAAQLHGVTLVGFARAKKLNIYTHSGRIKTKEREREEQYEYAS